MPNVAEKKHSWPWVHMSKHGIRVEGFRCSCDLELLFVSMISEKDAKKKKDSHICTDPVSGHKAISRQESVCCIAIIVQLPQVGSRRFEMGVGQHILLDIFLCIFERTSLVVSVI